MILKHESYENGFCFLTNAQNYELQAILKAYGATFKKVICNEKTAHNFREFGNSKAPIQINNELNDGCFFVNSLT